MLAKAPPERLTALPAFPGWQETVEERTTRYERLADAAIVVGKTRERVALLLAVSYHESGWAPDVDVGPCYRGADGMGMRCDGGRAACVMQVRVDAHPEWKADELFGSREACFRAGLTLLERSRRACSKLGPDFFLDAYAGGTCEAGWTQGHAKGLELLRLAQRFRKFEGS
jgi:hypothetical protein